MNVKILTAHDLRTGQVVFLDDQGEWTTAVLEAQIANDTAAEQDLAEIGQRDVMKGQVVECEVIPAVLTPKGPVPVRNREQIRAFGPTVRKDLGRQIIKVHS